MKLKLIQAGGFAGKPMTAEDDLSKYPATLIQFVKTAFSNMDKAANRSSPAKPVPYPDSFRYFVEFDNKQLPLEVLENNIEFTRLISKLKAQLHY
ncbi:hypothetical protein [Niabella soli]|uniref:Uncharacterized protein n=1 Tax=Niabella soli DSM 19437 TaxID=929713 RepID=W0F2E3_9BACT|nr:hypothetical protein [Niabella soli]AHF17167.1 hypothetical protein NIASO_02840 [Niabella soli DSM 19437]